MLAAASVSEGRERTDSSDAHERACLAKRRCTSRHPQVNEPRTAPSQFDEPIERSISRHGRRRHPEPDPRRGSGQCP